MRHRIKDYTDRDLRIAIRSPNHSQFTKDLMESEILRRAHEINEDFELILKNNYPFPI